MVRGNWQRRVEQAEARRAERKEWKLSRKQEAAAAEQLHRGGRRYYEELFVNYLQWLEQQQSFHDEKQTNKLFIWVNKKPKSSPEIDTGPTVVKEHGNKHNILQDEDQDNTKGKKGGGGRGKKKNGGKQQHPRSHAAAAAANSEGGGTKRDAPSFCRPYFFYGTCCHGDETGNLKSPSSNKKGNRRKQQHDDDSRMISQCCHGLLHSTFPLSDALSNKKTTSNSNIKLSYQSSLLPKGSATSKATARMRMSSFGSEGDDKNDFENDTPYIVDSRMELLYHMSIPLTVGPITTGQKEKKACCNKSDNDDNVDDDNDNTMEEEEEEEHPEEEEDDNDGSSSESSSESDHRKKRKDDVVPNETTTSMLVQRMEHSLREEGLNFSNVVYATFDGCLSYDRYRCGNLLLEDVVGSNTSSPSKDKSFDRKHSSLMNDQSSSLFVGIPIPVDLLEFILGFLPSRYAGIMSMVCQSYAYEIGKLSPHLWKHYIRDRHHWPLTSVAAAARTNNNQYKDHHPLDDDNNHHDTDDVVKEAFEYRHLFVSHFEAVKVSEDVAMALQQTISSSSSQRGTTTTNSSSLTAYQTFKSTKDAPDPDNTCVSMKFWNDPTTTGNTTEPPRTKCICAFSRDGTIRAYETVPSSTSSTAAAAAAASNEGTATSAGPSVVLRQTVIARAMPLVRDSTLIAMDLDDTYIACLSHVPDFNTVDDELPPVKCVLTFASLNNFWSSGVHGASSSTQVQQTKQLIFQQDVSMDDLIQQHLIHTLGYNPNNFFINLSRTIISCGLGYFMMDVSVVFRQGSDEANPYWRKQYIALVSCSTPNEFVLFEDLSKIFGEHGHLLLTSRRVVTPSNGNNKSTSRSNSCSTMIVAREETPSFRGVSMLLTIDKTGVSLEMSAPFGTATTEHDDEENLFRAPVDVNATRTFLDSTLCDIVPSCDYAIHVSNNVRTLPNGTAYIEATISFDRLSSLLLFSKESKSLPGGASQQSKKDETLLLEEDEQQEEVALPTISMKHCYICQIIALGNDHVMTVEFLEHLEDDDQPRTTNNAGDGGNGHGDHEALTTSTTNETAATVAATAAAGMNDNSQMVVAGEGTIQNREDELEEVLEEEDNEFDGQWFMIDDRHIIDFGGPGGADPQRRGRRAAANGGGGSKYAISVYHISSGQRLERIIMPSLQPSSIQFIVASAGTSTNSNSIGVAPIGHGLVISGLWDSLQWNAQRQQQRAAGLVSGSGSASHVDMDASGGGATSTPQNKNTKKKKKKKLASMAKGRNKDGFARGMSVRG